MAQGQATFLAKRIDWDIITHYYYDVAGFDRFIFQPEADDTTKAKKDFVIIGYALNASGYIINDPRPITFELANDPHVTKTKLNFGNIPFTKEQIKCFIDDTSSPQFEYLFFKPIEYKNNYIAYEVSPEPVILNTSTHTLVSVTLNPSPPADPL